MDNDNRKLILLVEDEVIIALSEKAALEKYGYNIMLSHTGENAVEIFKEKNNIDLILMDIDLGKGIDGTQAASLILKNHNIPIVFCSSHSEPEIVDKTEKITSYGYVLKSSDPKVLDVSIKMALKLFEANRKAIKSEERFRFLFQNLNSNFALHEIILDETNKPIDYRFLEVNPSFEKAVGIKAKDIIGKTALELFPKTEKYWIEQFGKVALTQKPIQYENYSIELQKYFEMIVYSPQKNQFAMIGLDITDRKNNEKLAKESQSLYHDLVETSQDLIFQCDADRRYTYLNPAWEDLFGYKIEEMIGKRFVDFQSKEIGERDTREFLNILQGNIVKGYETIHLNKSGEEIHLVFNAKVVKDNNGKIVGGRGTAYDITERKKVESELKRQLQDKAILLKEVHHRIKNNIASTEGLLSLQLQSIDNPEAISVLQDAIGHVRGMRLLYDKLLINDNYEDISVKDYLNSLIEAILTFFPQDFKIKKVTNIDEFNLSSKNLFSLGVIINELLTNIMKHAFEGRDSGIINIELKKIENQIILTIQDNGNGLPNGFDLSKSEGFGLMLVRILSGQLDGVFTIDNHNGTRSILKFDIK